jgi:cyclopropane-fatty-acyl-phospholipid synthase
VERHRGSPNGAPAAPTAAATRTQALLDVIAALVPDVRVSAYDGAVAGPADADTQIRIASPRALVRVLRAPRGLGLARAWVMGEITIDGDLASLVHAEHKLRSGRLMWVGARAAVDTLRSVGLTELWRAGPTAIEQRHFRPGRHTTRRDLADIDFHYSLTEEFYRKILGSSMTYSSGMFDGREEPLEVAQDRKHTAICRKLSLTPESTLLDIGCGWGAFVLWARERIGCAAIGLTASRVQEVAARRQVDAQRLDNVTIHHGDYRQILPLRDISAAASIGMYEHVGEEKSVGFFKLVRKTLAPGSLYLNQAICRRLDGPRQARPNAFTQRYIFPNGQLLPLGQQLSDLEKAGFRVRDVETFGESYARTLGAWHSNLCRHWDACVALEGEARVRAWQIYLLGARRRFTDHSIDVAQVLAEAR